MEALDLVNLAWESRAPLPVPRSVLGLVSMQGCIYAIGGYNGTSYVNNVERYAPLADSWQATTPLPCPRGYVAAVVVDEKNGPAIYVLGGNDGSKVFALVERFDTKTFTWAAVTPMMTARRCFTGSVVDRTIIVTGGVGGSDYLASVECYDVEKKVWRPLRDLPAGRQNHAAAAVNGSVYVMGGQMGSDGFMRRVDRYIVAKDTWEPCAPLPVGRPYIGATAVDAKVFALGGYHGTDRCYMTDVHVYTPETNSWSSFPPMPTPRSALGVVAV